MMTGCCALTMALGAMAGALAAAEATSPGAAELVLNADFAKGGEGGLPAADWTPLALTWQKADCTVQRTGAGLRVEAPGRPFAVGGVSQELRGVQGGHAYAVEAMCELRQVPSPLRSALVRLIWTAKESPVHPAGLYIRGPIVREPRPSSAKSSWRPRRPTGRRCRLRSSGPKAAPCSGSGPACGPPCPRRRAR